jgi:hypothetical protein
MRGGKYVYKLHSRCSSSMQWLQLQLQLEYKIATD